MTGLWMNVRERGLPTAMQTRQALLEVLRATVDEARRLAEMIRLLRPDMERVRLAELLIEWRVARERVLAYEMELRILDDSDTPACLPSQHEC
jgi:hypothetical protein